MRYKLGFKASCSSMAFIVRKDVYGSVFNLAKHMIKERMWDNDLELIVKLEHLEISGIDPDINLSFATCNYDTYMSIVGDDIWVTTSNNHSYWDMLQIDKFFHEDEDHPIWEIRSSESFLDLETGTVIKGRTHALIDKLKNRISVLEREVPKGICSK